MNPYLQTWDMENRRFEPNWLKALSRDADEYLQQFGSEIGHCVGLLRDGCRNHAFFNPLNSSGIGIHRDYFDFVLHIGPVDDIGDGGTPEPPDK